MVYTTEGIATGIGVDRSLFQKLLAKM